MTKYSLEYPNLNKATSELESKGVLVDGEYGVDTLNVTHIGNEVRIYPQYNANGIQVTEAIFKNSHRVDVFSNRSDIDFGNFLITD
jgi:hypothetical protein